MTRMNPWLGLALNLVSQIISEQKQAQVQRPTVPEVGDVPCVKALKQKDGGVELLLGRRESGKTTLALRLAEVIGRPTYMVSPEQKPPNWVHELRLEEIADMPPPGSTLILDDLPVYMGQRDYYDPLVKEVEKIIPVARHRRKLILIFLGQSSGLIDKFALDSDLIFLKAPNLLYLDTERASVAKWYKSVKPIFDSMTEKQRLCHAVLLSQDFRGLVRINLPTGPMGNLNL